MLTRIKEHLKAILEDARGSRERKRLAYEFGALLDAVRDVASRSETPEGTRAKADGFLRILAEKEVELGAAFFQDAFLLNIVAEAMARESYLAQPVVAFLRSALYFHGIGWIERNQQARSLGYLAAHAELVMSITSRRGLKDLLATAAERFDAGRPFCLSNLYLAELKKLYWAKQRASEDACDRSVSLDVEAGRLEAAGDRPIDREALPVTAEDRVQVMLRVFAHDLSEIGQKVYFLRHPISRRDVERVEPDLAAQLAAMLDGDEAVAGRAGWRDVAAKLGLSEKLVKKEYMRALHDLLAGAAREVYGERLPSSFVRRVLRTLRAIVQERDLKIRENAGEGMARLVERWEIALRFVLNDERLAPTASADRESAGGSAAS